MTTANDQINGALRLIGQLAEGETPSAATSQDALTAMNQMLDSWSSERLSVFSTQDQVFTWTQNLSSRTLGPTGDFVGNRPVLVDDSTYFVDVSNGISFGIKLINQQQYNGIAVKVVEEMKRLGATDIHATLGASICGRCYEVSQEIQDEVCTKYLDAFALTREHTPALDLSRALITVLVDLGVSYEASSTCTLEDPHYFSYRRHNITGRNAGVVWL